MRNTKSRIVWTKTLVIALFVGLLTSVSSTSPAHAWENNKQYKETQTASPAPAGTFAAGAGGDGWGISVYNGKVYNIYHNSGGKLTLDCHNRTDGRPCWNTASATLAAGWTAVSYQIQNNTNTGTNTPNILLPAYGPGQWIDPTNGMLYAYTVNSNGTVLTPGIVQVDTSKIDPAHLLNGASKFFALASPTVSCANSVGSNCLTPTIQLNRKIFSVNFVTSAAKSGTSTDANKVMCFDADTKPEVAACAGNPITLPDAVSGTKYNVSQVGTFGDNLLIPLSSASGSAKLECLSSITLTTCAGWTAPTDATFSGNGAAFPMLSTTGVTTGVCLPDATISCYNMSGTKVTTPTGLSTVLPNKSGSRNGTSVTVGTRVFVPTTTDNMVHCIDWAVSGLVCTSVAPGAFPFNAATAGASSVYTVGTDSNDPTCIWLNSDKGTATYTVPGTAITISGVGQIQSFDAYSGKACGSSGVRVLLQNFLAPGAACAPASYISIQLSTPKDPSFTTGFSGTVSFLNVAGTQLKDSSSANVADATISDTGTVNMPANINNLATGVVPTIQITLLHSGPYNNDIAVAFTWLSTNDPACTPAGYSEEPYTISFDLNGPAGANILIETVTQGAPLSTGLLKTPAPDWNTTPGVTNGIPNTAAPAPAGWTGTFTGWATSPSGGSPVTTSNSNLIIPSGNTTYYAQWNLPGFTVVFDSYGGIALSPNSESITVGEDLGGGSLNVAGNLPEPSWTDSTKGFTGWYTETGTAGSLVTDATVPGAAAGETVTYYAHWELAIVVTTSAATSITQTTARINGSISTANPSDAFFCEDNTAFTSGTVTLNPISCNSANLESVTVTSSPATYSYNLTGLTADTTYWFMQVGIQSGNIITGAVLTFKTLANVVTPPPAPPTPTPTPSATPTPTHAPTPSATPTPSAVPTPSATPRPTPSPTITPGVLTISAPPKKVVPNQIVPINQTIALPVPENSEVKDLLVNGKRIAVSSPDPKRIHVPVLIGPKDKVFVEVKQPDGTIVSIPITQSKSSINIANVNFDSDAYFLTAKAKKILDNVAAVVLAHGFTTIDLIGHTDTDGANSGYDNQALSHNRAIESRAYLLKKLAGHKVSVKIAAKAQVDPIAVNSTKTGRAANRRVEIAVH